VSAAISIEGVGKRFRLYRERPTSLKQRILHFRLTATELWALRDVSIEVPQGQTLGLIGPNGSGKTTLLKVVSGILRPTEGRVAVRGRIAALLALAAGFHSELTGRENVYLNASILGFSRQETDRLFDDIVAFAELEEFIDNQVKFYSSGMYVRLGFAVAVHVDPAILLVDEVLAVGDEGFQRKCFDRVRQFQREGRTIVFVTHAADLVREFCDSAVMLKAGRIHTSGDPEEVVREFRLQMLRDELAYAGDTKETGTRDIEIVSAELMHEDGTSAPAITTGESLIIQVDLRANRPVEDPVISFALHDEEDRFLFGTNTDWRGVRFHPFEGKKRIRFHLRTLPFVTGRYWVTLGVHSRDSSQIYHVQEHRARFSVHKGEENPGRVYIPVTADVEDL
jgi:ABC-type polysaccharide/polyol phosphate transport system ATPase subunit